MSYDNTNRWTLNKVVNKQSDTHADYSGRINVNGVEYWLNGWIKDGPNGKFISGNIKPLVPSISEQATAKIKRPDPISTGRPRNADMNDDIPF